MMTNYHITFLVQSTDVVNTFFAGEVEMPVTMSNVRIPHINTTNVMWSTKVVKCLAIVDGIVMSARHA
ncbi:hypothetical protein PAXRUDRAFT_777030 [Paxillus rubicundulus Ve08.2h10]|uniref:Uncharacterized protein n=1 Tax=Paxillus rubicundulus Ve08.2h10 TaxID=930991 RepID=A0A0D0DMN9_9AGAM|nr:hypothetical protein PAXRUDRAFT_777030 [Paxillus rubicundulus Ve08.2h10]